MSFKLESAINQWRSKLRRYNGFEDGDITELEDHLRNGVEDKKRSGISEEKAFNLIMKNDYSHLKTISKQFQMPQSCWCFPPSPP